MVSDPKSKDRPDFLSLPPLREVVSKHDLRAEKKLGQNFILDLNITNKIASKAGDLSQTTVFEVGPGPGGLTRSLLHAGAEKLIAIEYDPRAVKALQDLQSFSEGRFSVIEGDALKTNFLDIAPNGPRIIVANLPYNIATPLLISWLKQVRNNPGCYDRFVLMFQKEVADRIVAPLGSKTYGRLSIVSQWLCDAHIAFDLPPSAFTPPPKVKSSIVVLEPKEHSADMPSFEVFEQVTAAAFNQRRKMLRSSLKKYIDVFEDEDLDLSLRAEQLSVQEFEHLAKVVEAKQ